MPLSLRGKQSTSPSSAHPRGIFVGCGKRRPNPHEYITAPDGAVGAFFLGAPDYRRTGVVPSVLEWPGPVIVNSRLPALLRDTLGARRSWAQRGMGEVHVFDPLGSFAGVGCSHWPIHDGCADEGRCQRRAEVLIDHIWPDPSVGDEVRTAAALLLPAVLHAAALESCPPWQVLDWISHLNRLGEARTILKRHGADAQVVGFDSFVGIKTPNTQSAVFNAVRLALVGTGNQRVRDGTGGEIETQRLLSTASTLYVPAAPQRRGSIGPLVATLLVAMIERHAQFALLQPALPLLVVLDESGPLDDVPDLLRQGAGSVHAVISAPSLADLRKNVGPEATDAVLSACQVIVFWGGRWSDAEELARRTGEEVRKMPAKTYHGGLLGWLRPPLTRTETDSVLPVLRAEQLHALPQDQAVCLFPGQLPFKIFTPDAARLPGLREPMGSPANDPLLLGP